MGWRGTLILVLLVVVVGVYVWIDRPPLGWRPATTLLGGRRPTPERLPAHPLLPFKPDEIVSVRLERQGQIRSAERLGGVWRGSDDPDAVDDFLTSLSGLGPLAEIPCAPGELADYGLQTPQTVVRLQQRGQPGPLVLQVGDRNPATTGVYVRLGEQGNVVLAGALVAWEVDELFAKLSAATPTHDVTK